MLGRVEDPASELSNGDIYMTNSKRDSSKNQSSAQNTMGDDNPYRR